MSSTKSEVQVAGCKIGGDQDVCKTIAIVGGGFSGTMVAVQLLRHATKPVHIKLIERSTTVGRGVAYATHYASHVLNVPAGSMGAFPDDPGHFLSKTLEEGRLKGIDGESFVPRKIYGQYIERVLSEALCDAHPDVTFDRIAEDAIGIDVTSDEWAHIKFDDGRGLIADKVVLAIGNLPPADPPIPDTAFYHSHRYFSRAWSDTALRWLFPDQPVLLLGSGLTCVDVITALREQGHKGLIHVVSRRGLLPHVHRPAATIEPFLKGPDAQKGVRWLVYRIRQEATEAMAQGQDWRAVFDSLRPVTRDLWTNLSIDEKRRFLRHMRPFWETHRHRCAPAAFHTVADMLRTGQVVLHAGQVSRYVETRDGVEVEIARRMKAGSAHLNVSRVINCTGPLSDYRKLQQPLMRDLMVQGAITPDELNQGLAVTPTGSLIDADGKAGGLLYTLGPPAKGTFWECTAVPEIRAQALELAKLLLG
jgi:uncharacterized NAD(P)/FAD-binding protein YdhS